MKIASQMTGLSSRIASNLFSFTLALVLVVLLFSTAACGIGDEERNANLPVGAATVQPPAASEPAPTAAPEPAPTTAPAAPTAVPMPTAVPTAEPTPMPTATMTSLPSPSPTANSKVEDTEAANAEEVDTTEDEETMTQELPPGCLTDGSLTDPKLILSCSNSVMNELQSVRVDLEFNLGALLPAELPPDSAVPSMQMQIDRVFPDRFSIVMVIPGGETVRLILVEGETYVRDGTTDQWFKVPQSQDEFSAMLLSLNMVEQQVEELENPDIVWNDVTLDPDGTGYLVSYRAPVEQMGMQAPPMEIHLVVDTGTFLQQSVALLIPTPDGDTIEVADFLYSDHNEPFAIAAPENYIEADPSMMPPGPGGSGGPSDSPEIISLSRNSDDNVEVYFNAPVTVNGEVGLYVLEPSTGGWSLPYLSGSGTDTLTFDAADTDNPPLVPGESLIVGFTFDSPESDLVDESGRPANINFEEWVYPE